MKKLFILFSLFALIIQGLALTFSSAQTMSNAIDGQTLFQKITALADQLNQPGATDDTRIPYLMSEVSQNDALTPKLSQFFFANGTTVHATSSEKDANSDQLGSPSTFPQLWIKYDNQGALSEIGRSGLTYPTSFGIDPKAHPSLVLDFVNKTASFPSAQAIQSN